MDILGLKGSLPASYIISKAHLDLLGQKYREMD